MATFKSFKDLEKSMRKKAKNLVKEAADMEADAAEMSAELIQDRTRRGFGVEKDNAPKQKLKKLSPAYIKQRAKEGLTGKSRLGRTDRMLNNVSSKKNKVILKGKRSNELAEFAEDSGRPFMHLSSAEKKKVTKFLKDLVAKFFAKNT